MPICYLDNDYSKKYSCEYVLENKVMVVHVDYDIIQEVPEDVNGVKIITSNTEYKERDILIIDFHCRKNLLVKRAFYAGNSEVYGTPDGGSRTTFRSSYFFEHENAEKLICLNTEPEVQRIRVYSKAIIDLFGCNSIKIYKCDDTLKYELSKKSQEVSKELNANNIEKVTISDEWSSFRSHKEHNIHIDYIGYIELSLVEKINYREICEYVYELIIFMQLYWPDKFVINKICVLVNEETYFVNTPLPEYKEKEKTVRKTVEDNLLDYLERCYKKVPYRNSKSEIRNVPYIVLKTARGLEDNFLMFYRFIECFYKERHPAKSYILSSMNSHYKIEKLDPEKAERYSQEIVCLRNHYVHSGYYIKNSSLRITFPQIGKFRNPKDYEANDVDADWIYDRTKMLYQIVIDIIFREMLEYEEYCFLRHF